MSEKDWNAYFHADDEKSMSIDDIIKKLEEKDEEADRLMRSAKNDTENTEAGEEPPSENETATEEERNSENAPAPAPAEEDAPQTTQQPKKKKKRKKEDFSVDVDFEKEYPYQTKKSFFSFRREKRTGCVGGFLYGVLIICISLVCASFLWMWACDVLALGKDDTEIVVTLPDTIMHKEMVEIEDDDGNVIGEEEQDVADVKQVANIFEQCGLIKYKNVFRVFSKLVHAKQKIAPGTYKLNTKYDYRALVSGVTPGVADVAEVFVSIPEGYTMAEIMRTLEENEVCTEEALWEAAANTAFEDDYDFLKGIPATGDKYRLEGFLFPDSYYFYVDDDPVRVIEKFLDNFENKFGEEYLVRAQENNCTVLEVVTIASMIEREASNHEGERDIIASVIFNRINSSDYPYLNIDATILYGMERNGDGNLSLDTEYDTPYNTYLHEGLPPGPVCNPSELSIRAALYPEESDYYFYALHKDEGEGSWHEFFEYYDDFINFINSEEYGG